MSVKEWFDKKVFWELTVRADAVAPLMVASSAAGKNRFKLKPAKKNGKVVYFTVAYKPGALPAVWKKVTLFPRGTTPAAPPSTPLPDQPDDVQLLRAIGEVETQLQERGSSTERLEGEIDVKIDMKTKRAALTLVQIPKAINGSKALLCLFITFDARPPGGEVPSPDGSGGGSSGSN